VSEARVTLEQLLPRLRCPASGGPLRLGDGCLESEDGRHRYPLTGGVADLRRAPERLRLDLPWLDPWDELDALRFDAPAPLRSPDLPYHLHPELARIAGERGDGRWLVEIGCGERLCEPYFAQRGFRYVGVDVDHRGAGPHLLADAHNLPLADAAFDLYLSLAVYEHLQAPLLAALEAYRVLRPGGIFFGSAAFVYGFHDRASFYHMSHAALLVTFRSAGFEALSLWPDWSYPDAIAEMGFRGLPGLPWRAATRMGLHALEWSFTRTSNAVRAAAGRPRLDLASRRAQMAGSLSFAARKPAT
jgi:SAM-dependent methyltransferase